LSAPLLSPLLRREDLPQIQGDHLKFSLSSPHESCPLVPPSPPLFPSNRRRLPSPSLFRRPFKGFSSSVSSPTLVISLFCFSLGGRGRKRPSRNGTFLKASIEEVRADPFACFPFFLPTINTQNRSTNLLRLPLPLPPPPPSFLQLKEGELSLRLAARPRWSLSSSRYSSSCRCMRPLSPLPSTTQLPPCAIQSSYSGRAVNLRSGS